MELNIEKIKPSTAFAIISTISPVFVCSLLIFFYSKPFFLSADIFKLLILSIGMTFPLLSYNYLLVNLYLTTQKSDDVENHNRLTATIAGFYTSFILALFCGCEILAPLPIKSIIYVVAFLEAIVTIFLLRERNKKTVKETR